MVGTDPPFVDVTPRQPGVLVVTPASLAGITEALAAYHAVFAPCFPQPTQQRWSELYLRGLLVADVPRKNVEALAFAATRGGRGCGAPGAGTAAFRERRRLGRRRRAAAALGPGGADAGRG